MPYAIASIGREKRLTTLAKNLYVIEGPNPAEALRRAAAALLRANPKLANAEAFVSGTPVRVPTDIGLALSDRVTTAGTSVGGGLIELTQRLQLTETLAQDGFEAGNKVAQETVERLSDRTFRATLLKQYPNAEALVAEAAKTQSERQESNKLRQERVASALQDAVSQLEKLRKLAGDK